MARANYEQGSIVNLMSSFRAALGRADELYPGLPALDPARVAEARDVVLVVVDGLGHDFLTGPGRDSRLHALLAARITSVFPPTTATAITTFMTGAAPQQHALTGWFTYLRELGAVAAVLPFTPRSGAASFARAGVSPAAVVGRSSVFAELRAECHAVLPARIANSAFSRALCGPATRHGVRSPRALAAAVRRVLAGRRRKPRFIYAYWAELDRLSHEHGPQATPVLRHFAALDAALGELVEALAGRDTLLVVTADHGFIESPRERRIELADHPELAATLLLPLCGEPRAAYCYVHPRRAAAFERYIATQLAHCAELAAGEDLIAGGWFGLGAPNPRLAERVGHYVLLMREDWVIRDRVLGEDPPVHAGVHGGTSERELYVPLCLAGP